MNTSAKRRKHVWTINIDQNNLNINKIVITSFIAHNLHTIEQLISIKREHCYKYTKFAYSIKISIRRAQKFAYNIEISAQISI